MYFSVKKVRPVPDYELVLTFEDGNVKKFDMKPFLEKGIFRELKNEEMFNTVRVSFSTVVWDNEADFDPEALYEGGLPIAN